MLLFNGFPSKSALKAAVKARPITFSHYAQETSFFGPEILPLGTPGVYCVCMDHPKRTKFAEIAVDARGIITRVS